MTRLLRSPGHVHVLSATPAALFLPAHTLEQQRNWHGCLQGVADEEDDAGERGASVVVIVGATEVDGEGLRAGLIVILTFLAWMTE